MNPKLNFNFATKEWTLETPVALNLMHLTRIVNFTKEVYRKRILGETGEKRKDMEYAVSMLETKNIKQKLVGPEPTLFHSGKY